LSDQHAISKQSEQRDSSALPLEPRCVLHVGCGPYSQEGLHGIFRGPAWREIRVDIDPAVKPDIQASITDLRDVSDASVDAVWSSHSIEHLYDHEVAPALRELARVLRPTGFALMTCPDLEAIAQLIASGVDQVAYESPAGPITPLDMLFGHRRSIERGNLFMCHRTGFTEERLGRVIIEAGFLEAQVLKGQRYDLWAVGLMAQANQDEIGALLSTNGLPFALGKAS
jgi:predicted SAM-dependent methyltransferase